MSNLVNVIQEVIRRTIPSTIESGTIQTISGGIAQVYISGSKQTVPAFFSSEAHPQQGDDCVLVKANRAAPWVILTSYAQRSRGHSNYDRDIPAHQLGATYYANVETIAGGGTTSSTTTYGEKLRIKIRTRGGAIVGAYNGYATGSNSTARILYARLSLDGDEIAQIQQQMPTAGGFHANMTLFGTAHPVKPGYHTLTLGTYASVASVSLSGILHALEI